MPREERDLPTPEEGDDLDGCEIDFTEIRPEDLKPVRIERGPDDDA